MPLRLTTAVAIIRSAEAGAGAQRWRGAPPVIQLLLLVLSGRWLPVMEREVPAGRVRQSWA